MSERNRRAEQLRKSFDETFTRPPYQAPAQTDMLMVTVGGTDRAVRLGQITRVARNPGTVPVPALAASFIGVAGMRGAVLPVFSLASLLGLDATTHDWLLIVQGSAQQESIAFSCEAVRGYVQVKSSSAPEGEVVTVGNQHLPVIDLYSLRAQLEIAPRSKNANG